MHAGLPPAAGLPWRSDGMAPRPERVPLPSPEETPWRRTTMPLLRSGRPLKRWRYVGVYGAELMLCVGDVHIGPARQTFWGVWDRQRERLYERTHLVSHRALQLDRGRLRVREPGCGVEIDLVLDEDEGISSVCPHGRSGYVWTRKQGAIAALGRVVLPGAGARDIQGWAVIDDTAGYHARQTSWRWSAGIGVDERGERVAWNLVAGVNDPPSGSERSIWRAGVAREVGPVRFADDLGGVAFAEGGELRFSAESMRRRRDNLLVLRSDYEQPFGTFAGTLPGGVSLREGYGVIERHSARW